MSKTDNKLVLGYGRLHKLIQDRLTDLDLVVTGVAIGESNEGLDVTISAVWLAPANEEPVADVPRTL